MKRCPVCHRFGVEYNSSTGKESCLWDDCLWTNESSKLLKEKDIDINFTKFQKEIKLKTA